MVSSSSLPSRRPAWLTSTLIARTLAIGLIVLCADLVASGRNAWYAAAVALALSPLAGFTFLARPYVFPYALYVMLIPFDNLLAISTFGTATRFLGIAAGFAILLYSLRTKTFVRPTWSVLAWAIYTLWVGVTIAWAYDPTESMRAAGTVLQLLLLYLLLATAPLGRTDLRVIVAATVLGGVASGAYGSWVFYHQDPALAQAQQQLARLQIQVGQTGIDANHFADALLYPLVAITMLVLRERRTLFKVALLAGMAVMIVGIFLSGSREALVAFCVAVAYLIVVSRYRMQLIVVSAFTLGLSLATPSIWVRMSQSLVTGGSGRTAIWKTALAAIPDNWLLGAGIANFSHAYDNAYIHVFQQYGAGWSRAPHDLILQTIVELGVIGLAITLAALIAQFRTVEPIGDEDEELRDYRHMMQAAMLGLMTAALFIDLLTYKYLWLLFGSMAQLHTVASERPSKERRAPSSAIVVPARIRATIRPTHALR